MASVVAPLLALALLLHASSAHAGPRLPLKGSVIARRLHEQAGAEGTTSDLPVCHVEGQECQINPAYYLQALFPGTSKARLDVLRKLAALSVLCADEPEATCESKYAEQRACAWVSGACVSFELTGAVTGPARRLEVVNQGAVRRSALLPRTSSVVDPRAIGAIMDDMAAIIFVPPTAVQNGTAASSGGAVTRAAPAANGGSSQRWKGLLCPNSLAYDVFRCAVVVASSSSADAAPADCAAAKGCEWRATNDTTAAPGRILRYTYCASQRAPASLTALGALRKASLMASAQYDPQLFGCCPNYIAAAYSAACGMTRASEGGDCGDALCRPISSSGGKCVLHYDAFLAALLGGEERQAVLDTYARCSGAGGEASACLDAGGVLAQAGVRASSDALTDSRAAVAAPSTCPVQLQWPPLE